MFLEFVASRSGASATLFCGIPISFQRPFKMKRSIFSLLRSLSAKPEDSSQALPSTFSRSVRRLEPPCLLCSSVYLVWTYPPISFPSLEKKKNKKKKRLSSAYLTKLRRRCVLSLHSFFTHTHARTPVSMLLTLFTYLLF